MAIISTWTGLDERSANLAGTALSGIVNGAESAKMPYLNYPIYYYAVVAVQLGTITTTSGASITLRVTGRDSVLGSDSGVNGDIYVLALAAGSGVKTVVEEMVRIYSSTNEISVINNSGTTLPLTGNGLWLTPYGEQIIEI